MKQFKDLPRMKQELELLALTQRMFGGTSTRIKNILMDYIGCSQSAQALSFGITGFKITTQTLMVGVRGMEFPYRDLVGKKVKSALERLSLAAPSALRGLVSLTSRKFSMLMVQGQPVLSIPTKEEQSKRMNASIQFVFQSRDNPEKLYKILLFTNGSIKIPGVGECFALSEVKGMVESVKLIYESFAKPTEPMGVPLARVAMCNYLAEFPLADAERIDMMNAYKLHRENPKHFIDLCARFALVYAGFEVLHTRVVGFFKFEIPRAQKQPGQQISKQPTTSDRRQILSITIQVTARGKLILQGSTGDFMVTRRVLYCFHRLAREYFPKFVKQISA